MNNLLTAHTAIPAGQLDIPQGCTQREADPSLAPWCRQLSICQTGSRTNLLYSHLLCTLEHAPASPLGPVSYGPTELYEPHPAHCKPLSLGLMEHSRGKHATWCTVDTQNLQRWTHWRMKRHNVGRAFLSPDILKSDLRTVLHSNF